MHKASSPTVAFTEQLTSPFRVHHPATLAELLAAAGTCKRIVEVWGVFVRTSDTHKKSPGTCTIDEVRQLARVLQVSEDKPFPLVRHQAVSPAVAESE
ncbi:hypothetical protein [Hymenobacter terricola]|uniref:hypothetical protein n=1 Tax=Hymenobacter terricola TaxID=2819236 RepID=UPI001B30D1A8|nr:hypothetical protein [Hymenobacter terricola]